MRVRIWPVLLLSLLVGCTRLSDALVVPPHRQVTVTLVADGETRALTTSASSIAAVLTEAQVHLSALDRVEPDELLPPEDGMLITIIRVIEQYMTAETPIAYEQQLVRNEGLPEGDRRLLQAGQAGLEQVVYRIEYHDGVEAERRLVRHQVKQAAVPEIVMIGVKGAVTPVSIQGTLAYISGGNGVIVRTSSAHRDALATSGDLDGRVFSLSPDGGRLLYTRSVPVSATVTATLPAFNSLWVMVTTRFSGPVRPDSLGVGSVLWADWSPDGDQLVFSTARPIPQPPGWEANNDLWLARWDGRGRLETDQLLEPSSGGIYGWWGRRYAWSPNGRYLAYGQADEVGYIDVATGRRVVLGRFDVYHTYSEWVWTPTPTWSPDSLFVAAVAHGAPTGPEAPEDSQVFDLWAWEIDGWVSVPLARRVGMWGMPAWSPARPIGAEEASQIAYLQASDPLQSGVSSYALWITDRDGSDARSLFPPSGEIGLRPQPIAWSPDGNQIAFIYRGDLYLVSTAPGELRGRPLTGDGINSNPVWVTGEPAFEPTPAPPPEAGNLPQE